MSNTDKILLGVLTIVICVALVLGSVLKKPSVVLLNTATEAGQQALGYAEGTHLGLFTAEYIEALTELKSVAYTATGLITGSLGITITGADSRLSNVVQTGSVTGFTVSSTATSIETNRLTAANVCNQTWIPITVGNTTTASIYTPTVASLFADCLTTNGDSKEVTLYNTETVSTTVLADSETSSTLYFSSTTTLGASDTAIVKFIRDSAATLRILVTNQPS